MDHYLEFTIDAYRFALEITRIRKVERLVDIAPLPGPTGFVQGVVNFHGELVPVLNLRNKLSLSPVDLVPEMFLILVDTDARPLALLVDDTGKVFSCDKGQWMPGTRVDGSFFPDSLLLLDDGIILICNPDKFLNEEEKTELEKLLLTEKNR